MAAFLVFKFLFNKKNVPSLKVPLVIEDRKQARKQPQELLSKVRAPRNLLQNFFMLKLTEDFPKHLFYRTHLDDYFWALHVDFKLIVGNENNIFALKAATQISKCCKITANAKNINSQCKCLNKKELGTSRCIPLNT